MILIFLRAVSATISIIFRALQLLVFIPEIAGVPSKHADLLRIVSILAPRSFGGPLFDRAAHFRLSPISSNELRPLRKINTDSEVSEEIKVGKVFSTYITWYMLWYILLLSVEILKIDI